MPFRCRSFASSFPISPYCCITIAFRFSTVTLPPPYHLKINWKHFNKCDLTCNFSLFLNQQNASQLYTLYIFCSSRSPVPFNFIRVILLIQYIQSYTQNTFISSPFAYNIYIIQASSAATAVIISFTRLSYLFPHEFAFFTISKVFGLLLRLFIFSILQICRFFFDRIFLSQRVVNFAILVTSRR